MLVIGVDVGGTNTDAVCLRGIDVVASRKVPTTENVTSGLKQALAEILRDVEDSLGPDALISRVNIGTTHFVNAVIQRKGLTPVAVIRLCGTASLMMEPFIDFPEDLKQILCASTHLVNGGYQFNGEEITPLDEDELIGCIQTLRANGINNVVVSGIFSSVNPAQEIRVGELLHAHHPSVSVTLSHTVGHLSILERENASVLNECLKTLCARTVTTFASTLEELGLTCPIYLTQNDGTILSWEQALRYPTLSFSSGPTNSMRGAARLSGIENGIVVDIGGTSSDAGYLQGGFPKEASTKVKVGGVNTNFQMPDIICEGLGGGSCIRYKEEKGQIISLTIGPDSVGYLLNKESRVFGGATLTSSDIAVAAGLTSFGDPGQVADLPDDLINKAVDRIHEILEDLIDQVKLSPDDVPVIIVGGGSVLVDEKRQIKGVSRIIKPPHYQVANAVGAALSQVSGVRDTVVSLDQTTREAALEEAKQQAKLVAVEHGAQPDSVKITQVTVTPLAYLPGSAVRIKVKAVGDLMTGIESSGKMTDTASLVNASESLKKILDTNSKAATPKDATIKQASSVVPSPSPAPSSKLPEPNVDPITGEWLLSEYDVECIAIGAGILGCGGGGSPNLGRLNALKILKEGKKIRVIAPTRIGSTPALTGLVSPVGFMGAPGIMIEKLERGTEYTDAVECQRQVLQAGYMDQIPDKIDGVEVKRDNGVVYVDDYPIETASAGSRPTAVSNVVAVMSCEIGGTNAMVPFMVAAKLDLPVVDCDGMGRAFPELQMFAPAIFNHPLYPCVLTDEKRRRAVTFRAETSKDLENHFRRVVGEMGCQGALALSPLSRDAVLSHTVLHSVSRACQLGQAVLRAKRDKTPPIDAILKHENGVLLITGKIVDVSTAITGGFSRGQLRVEGTGESKGQELQVDFQNENLVARRMDNGDHEVLATTPDLITIVDADSGQPISTEELRFGLHVAVLVLASPPLLRTQRALEVVGPRAFGYDLEFKPVAEYTSHHPIPLPL
ncbi:uncharacterized protein [Asterias amurensis]|uniref:uncharacterized protein isoform X2 n=1 Tax=Asterias amurensis TaxID=7602 RepID=UPI003AB4BB0F